MDVELLRQFAVRYTAAWCSQNPSSVAAFFAENGSLTINDGSPAVGRAAIAVSAQGFMTAFPDLVVRMDGINADGEHAIYRWTLTGTNAGTGGTGTPVRISGYEQWTLGAEGLIVESRGHFDEGEYRRQLDVGGRAAKDVADAVRAEVGLAASLFRTWCEADVSLERGAGRWTRKEILGHLIDSASNNHQRFVRAQLSNAYAGPGYDQLAWVRVHSYQGRPWLELVELWAALNRHLAVVVESVSQQSLETRCAVGESEPVTLEWLMRDYVRHLKHHVEQIVRG